MSENLKIPTTKFSPFGVSFYETYTHQRISSRANLSAYYSVDTSENSNQTDSQARAHDGTLSETGRKNLLNSVSRFVYFLNLANERKRRKKLKGKRSLKFVTLTLASEQCHTDNVIRHELLNQFLTELRQKFKLTNYVWKAEKQKNENLHFHLLVDIFIPYSDIREIWNRVQNKLGYVDRFYERIAKDGFDFYYQLAKLHNANTPDSLIIERWKRGCAANWKNPPSTEIRQVERVRKIRAYFGKYFSKPTVVDEGFGRIWFASRTISNFPVMKVDMSEEGEEIRHYLFHYHTKNYKSFDYADVCYIDCLQLQRELNSMLVDRYVSMLWLWAKNFD